MAALPPAGVSEWGGTAGERHWERQRWRLSEGEKASGEVARQQGGEEEGALKS